MKLISFWPKNEVATTPAVEAKMNETKFFFSNSYAQQKWQRINWKKIRNYRLSSD